MLSRSESEKRSEELDSKAIVKNDEAGVLTAYFVYYAIRNKLDYVHLLPLVLSKFQKSK